MKQLGGYCSWYGAVVHGSVCGIILRAVSSVETASYISERPPGINLQLSLHGSKPRFFLRISPQLCRVMISPATVAPRVRTGRGSSSHGCDATRGHDKEAEDG